MFYREPFIGKNGILKKLLKIPHSGFGLGFDLPTINNIKKITDENITIVAPDARSA